MKNKFLSIVLFLALTFSALTPARPAQAASQQPEITAGLQEAFLKVSSQSFAEQDGAFTASRNGLDFALSDAGLQAQGEGIQWSLSLRGMERGGKTVETRAPQIVQTEAQLEYRRGAVTEWYRNTALGVEQGFTVHETMSGRGPLTVRLDLSTNLEGQLDEDGRGLSFAGTDGQTLRYDHLRAFDANGTELDAKMVYAPAQIILQVEADGAAYPITIDPLITLEQKVLAFDGATNEQFGSAVAISGATAIIGATEDDSGRGAAYIFTRVGGIWIQKAKLTASDRAPSDGFGECVAISGDTALVGAPHDQETPSDMNQGSAYIFVKPASGWTDMTETAKLRSSDGAMNDMFGDAVALSGDTALIGAPQHQGAHLYQGVAYIFNKPAGGWVTTNTFAAKLFASDGAQSDIFGKAVALTGDTALIGAPGDDVTYNDQGSAYIFVRPAGGWISSNAFAKKLTGTYQMTNDHFGSSVALSGDTAIVSAPQADVIVFVVALADIGMAYAYTRPAGGWTATVASPAELIPNDIQAGDQYGTSVAVYGDIALVGAADKADGCAAYAFVRPKGGSWDDIHGESQKIFASDRIVVDDRFGAAVAVSADTALVGNNIDYATYDYQGSAYFYPMNTSFDLGMKAAADVTNPTKGDSIMLVANIANGGDLPIAGVTASAPLPTGITYVSYSATHGSYDPVSGEWNVGILSAGVSASLTINVTVNGNGKTVFTASTPNRDSNTANNSASVTIKPSATFESDGAQDGWILETGENAVTGGTLNAAATTLRLGDDAAKKQYRAILSFDSSSLPDGAVITAVSLRVKRQSITGGGNPVSIFQGFQADIRKGPFGTSALQAADFQSPAANSYGPFSPAIASSWYTFNLTSVKAYVNKLATNSGVTQIRLRFELDDNNNAAANYLSLFSGNAAAGSRPQLIVEYYVP